MRYLVPFLLLLSACSLHRTGGADLPSVLKTQKPLYLTQRFEIVKGGKPFKFQGFAELEGNRLAIVGLTPVGNRGFSAVFENRTVEMDTMAFYRLPIKAKALLAGYQMMYGAASDLEELGFTVVRDGETRRILRGSRLIAQVTYSHSELFRGTARLAHITGQYTLTVDTRAVEDL